MAYDEGLAQLLRDDLQHEAGISERKMFGGLCFMLNGNMICGVMKEGGLFRVGKAADADGLALEGAAAMQQAGRTMAGFITTTDDLVADDGRRGTILAMALAYAKSLPPK